MSRLRIAAVRICKDALAGHDSRTTSVRAGDLEQIAMRIVLGLGVLLALCDSASAARVHHVTPPHVAAYPGQIAEPRFGRPRQSANPNDPPVLMDQTPSYDDPSKFGG